MIGGSLVSFLFLIMVVIIAFLTYKVYENTVVYKDAMRTDQDKVAEAARMIIQANTQNHPLFRYEHFLRAKIILQEIFDKYGGIVATERALKMPRGQLDDTFKLTKKHLEQLEIIFTQEIIRDNEKFDYGTLNHIARLAKRRRING